MCPNFVSNVVVGACSKLKDPEAFALCVLVGVIAETKLIELCKSGASASAIWICHQFCTCPHCQFRNGNSCLPMCQYSYPNQKGYCPPPGMCDPNSCGCAVEDCPSGEVPCNNSLPDIQCIPAGYICCQYGDCPAGTTCCGAQQSANTWQNRCCDPKETCCAVDGSGALCCPADFSCCSSPTSNVWCCPAGTCGPTYGSCS